MTYCVAMRLSSGLVFVSDSRTNAGVDHISTFRKLHVFHQSDERMLVIQSAGNLATTQSILSLLHKRCLDPDRPNMLNVASMYDAASLLGETVREVIARDSGANQGGMTDFSCNLLLGGQIEGEGMRLFHVYPQGNFIEATHDTPYFQVGESKYGKPIIDRVLTYNTALDQAMQCALISMDSTLRSNLSVGLPLDVMIYPKDSFSKAQQYRITEDHPYFQMIRTGWGEGLLSIFAQLPTLKLEN
ncbi:peptidase [Rouxiella sp. S1S-2]|uniref:proteasome-type protease n=1 Tax=Rouxiella sp. S1S-2 TaxID=2653856 RepID=UPI001264F5CA|nr:proteasome-type protease [Rouxiella sp. S1S-2]KAB7898523.1 peptidase [Rouxiella sp. S1S-2]